MVFRLSLRDKPAFTLWLLSNRRIELQMIHFLHLHLLWFPAFLAPHHLCLVDYHELSVLEDLHLIR